MLLPMPIGIVHDYLDLIGFFEGSFSIYRAYRIQFSKGITVGLIRVQVFV
ncbi:MAG: hypothetical protein QOJ40_213 [Verrucomicrobiota bacterium]